VPTRIEHAELVATLPFHHRDPFNRLIVAQSKIDRFPIIGQDETFDLYGVRRPW
jgi:PIN domain nuclease of toxin-antitoxin system